MRRQQSYLLSTLPGVVYRSEPEYPWRLTFLSDKVFSLTGFRASAFKAGKSWAEIVHPRDVERVRKVRDAVGPDVGRDRR